MDQRTSGDTVGSLRPIPAVLAIDIESDLRSGPPGTGVAAVGLERTHAFLSRFRPRLEDATGRRVRFAWFVRMDPQTEAQAERADGLVSAARSTFAAIEASDDRIGLHTHAGRWDAARRRWVADHADADWIDQCLAASFGAYAAAFGLPCREHRFGDRFSSESMYRQLDRLGAIVDLTPEPGLRGMRRSDPTADATGAIPDYRGWPKAPQRHSPDGPWTLPMSSTDPDQALPPLRRLTRRIVFAGQERNRPLTMERPLPTSGHFWELVERALDEGAGHLAWAIRSDLSLTPRFERVGTILIDLLARPLAGRLAFGGGEDALIGLGLLPRREEVDPGA